MTTEARRSVIRLGSLALGVALFAGALYYINVGTTFVMVRRLGMALPLVLLVSGLWHLARTWAWAACFPQPRQLGFLRLARVRLSAEAFSYLTFGWMAGEPLKVVLLSESLEARQAIAAVALERLAYMVVTTILVGVGSVFAMIGLPLTSLWFRVFFAFAIAAATVTALTIVVVLGRGAYSQSLLQRIDRTLGTSLGESKVAVFTASLERQMLDLVRGNPTRLLVPVGATAASYLLMVLEAWVILRASVAPSTPNGALAVETITRVASFASAFIPANLGTLEASNLAAAMAVGAAGAGAALALARRLRGLFWAGVGLAIYPRRLRARVDPDAVDETRSGRGATLLYVPHDPSVSVPPSAKLAGLPMPRASSAQRAGPATRGSWSGRLSRPSGDDSPDCCAGWRARWAAGSSWPRYRANGVPQWHRSIPPTP